MVESAASFNGMGAIHAGRGAIVRPGIAGRPIRRFCTVTVTVF